MRLVRWSSLSELLNFEFDDINGTALTIGNFDGLHLGHQGVLSKLKAIAKEHKIPAAVIVFEPHPKAHFAKKKGEVIHKRILPVKDQLACFKEYGVDIVYCIKFNDKFSQYSPCDFIKNILVDRLKVKHLLVGRDFKFGHKAAGNYDLLLDKSKLYNFDLSCSEEVEFGGRRVSSTWMRECLSQGDFECVSQLLGRDYILSGKIGYGKQLGRSIGFATINIKLPRNIILSGVFCVKVKFLDQDLDLDRDLGKS